MSTGLPYMGSKRKLAKKIVGYIKSQHPTAEYFIDLFGGGGAISYEAQKQGFKVVCNDKNKAIIALHKKIQGGLPDSIYDWVSREQFLKNRDRQDWYGGFLQSIWTFGNNGKDYLYGRKVEPIKHQLHKIIVECSVGTLQNFSYIGEDTMWEIAKCFQINDLHSRRKVILKILKNCANNSQVKYIEHLTRLNAIQGIEEIENRNAITFISLDYKDVEIPENSVVYLDPPYRDTHGYQEDVFHDELDEWAKNCGEACYMSEYKAPFEVVQEWQKRTTLCATANDIQTVEKLYRCN